MGASSSQSLAHHFILSWLIKLSSLHLVSDFESEHGEVLKVGRLLHVLNCLTKLALILLHLLRFPILLQRRANVVKLVR